MIDYVKILLKDIDVNRLENLSELDFKIEVSEKTGEVSTKKIAECNFCKVIIYDSGLVLFTGSIHKLWNSLHNVKAPNYKEVKQYKGFNGNQFTINDIVEVRQHLEALFNCDTEQMIFQNIEFGINTTPVFNPQLFLKGLLYHNGKPFEFRHKEHFAQAIHQRYYFKIYNKSNQYGMQELTLRVELKQIASDQFAPLGIRTFADINTSTLNKANELLLKRFDEVVYYDNTIVKESLSERQKQTLERYSNPRYWIDTLTKQNRFHHKNRLNEFIKNHSANLHLQIRKNIEQKVLLINCNSELKKDKKTLPITSVSENINTLPITSSSIDVISTNNTSKNKGRKCKITGVDISMQKGGSILLSHTGLKYYYKNNKKEFEKIQNKYLSKKWIDADFKTQIKELAHNIRNKHNNLKTSRELKYNPNQISIF